MKRLWVFFAALAVCTIFAGLDDGDTHDAAALVPVQALVIDAKDGAVFVTADTGDVGRGGNLDAALSDLQSGCAGALFTQGVVPCAAGLRESAASSGGEIIPGDGEN